MQMNVTFKALDKVNYDNLGCGSKQLCEKLHAIPKSSKDTKKKIHNPKSLQIYAAKTIVQNKLVVSEALENAPVHLMGLLLRQAFKQKELIAVSLLLSEWPQEVLDLKEICPDQKQSLFASTMEFDTAIVMGLMRQERTPRCKLKVLDLRGFHINEVFSQVLVGAVPLLSIPREKRTLQKMTEILLNFLIVEGARNDVRLGSEELSMIEQDLKPIVETLLGQVKHGSIDTPKDQKLIIKLDKLEFGNENNKFLEFLVMGALREHTPCCLEVANIYINASASKNEDLIDSCTPFLALLGQDPNVLQGLSLNNMERMIFQCILKGVSRFTNLKAFDIGNCNVCITGRTRVRSALRARIVNLFSSFECLTRLDMRKSELTGNMSELLEVLRTPLEFINLSGCHVSEDDLVYLGNCHHTKSLRELHLSSLVRKGEITSAHGLVSCVENMTETLVVLEIQNNEIGNDQIQTLCSLVPKFMKLKMLDTLYNFMSQESLLKLVKACANCPSLHCLALNLLPIFGSEQAVLERRLAFQQDCEQVLLQCKRQDMTLLVVAIGIE